MVKSHPARVAASHHREIETTPVEHCRNEDCVLRGEPGRDQSVAILRLARNCVETFHSIVIAKPFDKDLTVFYHSS